MYLNVRKPPLRYWNPLSFFFPRPKDESGTRSPSPPGGARSSRTIPTIPPAKNPRGELIFSSRVERSFVESYERYRAAFERRREEREYGEWKRTWVGRMMFWRRAVPLRIGSSSRGRSGTPASQ
jgi:hypothetical protein